MPCIVEPVDRADLGGVDWLIVQLPTGQRWLVVPSDAPVSIPRRAMLCLRGD